MKSIEFIKEIIDFPVFLLLAAWVADRPADQTPMENVPGASWASCIT
jgi:hypothetical protein